jgi:hypothetical protein
LRQSQWVLALYRNDTNHDVTIWVRGRSGEGSFVAFAHQVREDELAADDSEVVVLRDIGPNLPPPTRVLARCTVDFGQLFRGQQYLPPSSPKRHLYFRIGRGRIDQVPSLEGHKWKIDMPFSGPDYEGAIAKATNGSNHALEATATGRETSLLMIESLTPQVEFGVCSGASAYSR